MDDACKAESPESPPCATGQVSYVGNKLATELQIRGAIAVVREALSDRTLPRPNTWVFFSNKNDSLLTIEGDLYFIACVLFEGDSSVSSYSFEPSQKTLGRPHIVTTSHNGHQKTYLCITNGSGRGRAAPAKVELQDSSLITLTEEDFIPRMSEFSNWLMLSGAMTRARNFSTATEIETLVAAMKPGETITFREALTLPELDPALVLCSIAKGLATGVFSTETRSKLLELETVIFLGSDTTKSAAEAPWKPQISVTKRDAHSFSRAMPRNRRTLAHPELFSCPELWLNSEIPSINANEDHLRRSKAVQMYLFNRPYSEIQRETGFSESWVRKLFLRTLACRGGKAMGLAGLARYLHSKEYVRKSDLPKGNMEEGRKGGYAGAFSNLLAKFPERLFQLIEGAVLRKRKDIQSGKSKIREARVSWVDLHGQMQDFLRDEGLCEDDYPFNTRDMAYSSLVALCNAILFNRPIRWIESRGGKEAMLRAGLGSGESSLIQARWLNQIVELDFQKCDSAAVIEIQSPKGTAIDVPVARWWAGAMVEAFSEGVIATSDSFEPQTTEDCVMELLHVATSIPEAQDSLTRLKNCADGVWLPSQMVSGYAGQAWDILKLDRAWAHTSTNALAAVVSTVGCAVCFGAPKAWFARHLVERTFGKLTQAGPQNLPSTLGTGPQDKRKNKPDAQAIRYRFMQDDVCDLIKSSARWINENSNEGTFWTAPIDVMKTAVRGESGRFFPRPLPCARLNDSPLMWHTEIHKVEGNVVDGIAPFIRAHRTRFKGTALAKAWHMIGSDVYLQVFRRDIRKARVLSLHGVLVSNVSPEEKWKNVAISWRDHALIQKFGQIQKRHQRTPSPVTDFLNVKMSELSEGKVKVTQKKRDATHVARIERNAIQQANEEDVSEVEPVVLAARAGYSNILGPAPQPRTITRGSSRG